VKRFSALLRVGEVFEFRTKFVQLMSEFRGHRDDSTVENTNPSIECIGHSSEMRELIGSFSEIASEGFDFLAK
jgi:hypothetical protein